MGTWGHGNLDSDYALDELDTRSNHLVRELLLRAQRSESREYDEYDYTTLFVEFELVFALDAAKLFHATRKALPAPDLVRTLAQSFIADWDDYIAADGGFPERRKVILDTFERFAQICQTHEGEGALPEEPTPVAKQATPSATAAAPKPKKTKAKAKPKKKAKKKS